MKKFLFLFIALAVFLSACGSVPTFETLGNAQESPNSPEKGGIRLEIPEDAAVKTANADGGTIYFCDGYEILVETMSSGSLNETLNTLSGFGTNDLTLMRTQKENYTCYECAWTSAGEGGFQTGRAKILDDGVWHYCLTVLAPAETVGSLQSQWQTLFDSFALDQS